MKIYKIFFFIFCFLCTFNITSHAQANQDVDKISKNLVVNSSKLQVIHNGIDQERFSINNINSEYFRILFTSS